MEVPDGHNRKQDLSNKKKEEKDEMDGVPGLHKVTTPNSHYDGWSQFKSYQALIPIRRGQRELMTGMDHYKRKHALLIRPPGREAYPGDVFATHSQQLYNHGSGADSFSIVKVDPSDLDSQIMRVNAHIENVNNLKGYRRDSLRSDPIRQKLVKETKDPKH